MKILRYLLIAALALAPLPIVSAGWLPLVGPGGGVGGWTPASEGANLVDWYKADAGVTCSGACSNGSTVTGWADQSGNGTAGSNDLAPHFTNNTTFDSTGLGGKPSLGFVAGGQLLTATDAMLNVGTGNVSSCFMLASLTVSSSGEALGYASTGESPASGAHSLDWFSVDVTPSFTWAHAFASGTNRTVTANAEVQIGMVIDGPNNQAIAYLAGSPVGSPDSLTSFNFVSTGTFKVGGGLVGEVREVFCVKRVMSAAEISGNVTTYLTSRQ